MGRANKKKTVGEPTPDELERREMQRVKRQEAIALRAAGEEFVSYAKKRKPQERRKELARKAERATERNSVRRSAQKAAKKAKETAPEIVVIPIFWKGQAGQMGQVMNVCSDVEQALRDAGRNVVIDAGHKYTPGQKFAHWEHRGVKLRIEVGPQEASKGVCTVALTRAPGVPADRVHSVDVSAERLTSRLRELEQQLEGTAATEGSSRPPRSMDEKGAEEGEGDGWKTSSKAGEALKEARGGGGGDDLDDDFDAGPVVEEPSANSSSKRKKGAPHDEGSGDAKKQKSAKGARAPKEVKF